MSIPQTGRLASPGFLQDFCVRAEARGFDALWAVDHLVAPLRTASAYPLGRVPRTPADGEVAAIMNPNFEMVATLSWVGAITTRIRLGTSVAVLPNRNPLILARQVATIDALSSGRVVLGVGVGWLREETEALGMQWTDRGSRTEDAIRLMRSIWTAPDGAVDYQSPYFRIPPMDPDPRPAQRPVPILIGGHSQRALDRAGRMGDGWISAAMPPTRVDACVARVKQVAESSGRDADSLQFVSRLRAWSQESIGDLADVYGRAGVTHLQIPIEADDTSAALDQLDAVAETLRSHGMGV